VSRFVGLLYCPYRIPDENDKYVETFEDCDVFFIGHFSNKFNLEKNQAWNYIQQKHLLKNKNQDQKQCAGCSGGCVTDAQAGFQISEAFTPFSQKDEIFSRSFWDETIHSEKTDRFYTSYRKPLKEWKQVDGYQHRDFSVRNAGWHVADFFAERLDESNERREGFLDFLTAQRESNAEPRDIPDPVEMSGEIKHVAKLFGADLCGITFYDKRWTYTKRFNRHQLDEVEMDLPDGMTNTIVVAHEMDFELLRTVPSALSGTATGVGYSRDVTTLLALAQYIRNLGYEAYASMNDTALSIPMAIQAGLGEYGRHGLLITKEFGPRVRLGKIFTNLPLSHDKPIRFGVEAFCNVCKECAENCPPSAIDFGDQKETIYSQSNILGISKWTTDPEKCFDFWVKQVTDCSICIRVCPYNRKTPKWLYNIRIKLMGTSFRKFMLWLDRAMGKGERNAPSNWWNND
jgi:reductive dehalogenase